MLKLAVPWLIHFFFVSASHLKGALTGRRSGWLLLSNWMNQIANKKYLDEIQAEKFDDGFWSLESRTHWWWQDILTLWLRSPQALFCIDMHFLGKPVFKNYTTTLCTSIMITGCDTIFFVSSRHSFRFTFTTTTTLQSSRPKRKIQFRCQARPGFFNRPLLLQRVRSLMQKPSGTFANFCRFLIQYYCRQIFRKSNAATYSTLQYMEVENIRMQDMSNFTSGITKKGLTMPAQKAARNVFDYKTTQFFSLC